MPTTISAPFIVTLRSDISLALLTTASLSIRESVLLL